MKEKIRGEFSKKRKATETQRAIARSTAINRASLQKIEARQQYLTQLNSQCGVELKNFARQKDKYSNLLVDLIVQGCLKLMEDTVSVRCRKEDERVVKGVLDAAASKYASTIKRQTGVEKSVSLSVDTAGNLPANSAGGVQLLC